MIELMRHNRKWLRRHEAAEFLGVSVRTIDRWTKEGRITRFTTGPAKTIVYNLQELKTLDEPEPDYLSTNKAVNG